MRFIICRWFALRIGVASFWEALPTKRYNGKPGRRQRPNWNGNGMELEWKPNETGNEFEIGNKKKPFL